MKKENSMLNQMEECMKAEEKSLYTIRKYMSDARVFLGFIDSRSGEITKQEVLLFKQQLARSYSPGSANTKIASVNYLLRVLGKQDCMVKYFRLQHSAFREEKKMLSKEEYFALLEYAESAGDIRMCLLLQAIGSTGIRIGELEYIIVEAAQAGRAMVSNKGKSRVIMLPDALCGMLLMYASRQGISSGSIFITKHGKPMNRSNIYHAMKILCRKAGVDASKVFPHNLRHLFAVTYYDAEKDISRLADILGHSSINTTRLYTMVSTKEQEKQINSLGLCMDCTKSILQKTR